MAITLKHQTMAAFVARVRTRWENSSKDQKAKLATWLYNRFLAGDITQAQIRTAFELDTTEKWIAFRDKILALHDHYLAIQGA